MTRSASPRVRSCANSGVAKKNTALAARSARRDRRDPSLRSGQAWNRCSITFIGQNLQGERGAASSGPSFAGECSGSGEADRGAAGTTEVKATDLYGCELPAQVVNQLEFGADRNARWRRARTEFEAPQDVIELPVVVPVPGRVEVHVENLAPLVDIEDRGEVKTLDLRRQRQRGYEHLRRFGRVVLLISAPRAGADSRPSSRSDPRADAA